MKNPFTDVEVHWLKLVGALLLIFAAVYLPAVAASTAGTVAAVSAVLSAAGGALLADVFVTQKRFLRSISPRLNSINRLLATITSQISSVIIEEKHLSTDNHAINRLSEMVPGLRAIIADINDLAGEKFDPHILNETIKSIGELVTKLESGKIKPNSEAITIVLKNILGTLKTDEKPGIPSNAPCPYEGCDGQKEIELGAYPSTSKILWCDKCQKKYHAHLTADGSVATKEWGGGSKAA